MFGEIMALAFLVLISTTLDDFVVLLTFFGELSLQKLPHEEDRISKRQIITGYFLGFTVIVAISLIGIVIGSFAPADYVSLLGIVPFLIGVKMLYDLYKERCGKLDPLLNPSDDSYVDAESLEKIDSSVAAPKTWFGWVHDKLISIGLSDLTVNVMLTTMSVGSDNIVVYISLFSQSNDLEIFVILGVFYFMITVYSFISIYLVGKIPPSVFEKFFKPVLPFILMGLGLYILSDSILAEKISQ